MVILKQYFITVLQYQRIGWRITGFLSMGKSIREYNIQNCFRQAGFNNANQRQAVREEIRFTNDELTSEQLTDQEIIARGRR